MAQDNFWNQRYDSEDYLFGTAPAAFLVNQQAHVPASARTLVVADGEGRNSVWLAERGLDVVAMDGSEKGVAKARKLAEARGVKVDYHLADIFAWDWKAEPFDLVVAVFIQFAPPALRPALFEGLKTAVRPGGTLMLHGYTPKQVEYGTGGPPDPSHLYTEAMLREAFGDFEILRLEAYEAHVDEGTGHSGHSALIDLVARKPS